ncbi:hypothetical protein H261_09764 [Paramagnetospirillum caucaseum]|uniref:Phage envelope protein n=1 Tax=Paramagnetospirillum caucaseum TaxID=1244869 RepID=M3ABD3_9PROT|nr:DUF1398 family protein [Paramagnetospirillum caucaseum]EME70083.1 hypothetical protein H261_09764 [Paramagnetospirillum caucaseum]
MDVRGAEIAQTCLNGAEDGTMTFPQIVAMLMSEGFEGYAVDYRRSCATYYRPDGDSVVLPMLRDGTPVAAAFDAVAIQAAIREAQQMAAGYTYAGFCRKVRAAGCAGYMVSFSGRRALYFGRTAEIHAELFPDQAP